MAASPVTVSLHHLEPHEDVFTDVRASQTTVRLRAFLIPIYGHPTYQAMTVQHTLEGPSIPAIASTHKCRTITIGDVVFAIFYTRLPPIRRNLNIAVRAYLDNRFFFGEFVVFRVGSRGMRFVNLRAGDRAMAFKAAVG